MKRIRKAEQKCSETRLYRYSVGFAIVCLDALKTLAKGVLSHITELLIVISFIGMFCVGQAFDSNAINYKICLLFLLILAVLIVTLLKVKILEDRGDE